MFQIFNKMTTKISREICRDVPPYPPPYVPFQGMRFSFMLHFRLKDCWTISSLRVWIPKVRFLQFLFGYIPFRTGMKSLWPQPSEKFRICFFRTKSNSEVSCLFKTGKWSLVPFLSSRKIDCFESIFRFFHSLKRLLPGFRDAAPEIPVITPAKLHRISQTSFLEW